jgi:hypothetical protein
MFYKSIVLPLVLLTSILGADEADLSSVVTDNLGNMVMIWQLTTPSGGSVIQSAAYTTLGGWGATSTISATGVYSSNPVLIGDSSGNAVALWNVADPTTGVCTLYGSMRSDGGSWSTASELTNSNDNIINHYSAAIYGTLTKQVVATWTAYVGTSTNRSVFVSTATFGGAWSSPVLIAP